MLYTTPLIAVLGMAWHASAHMKMSTPVPFAANDPKFTNGPLDASGSDYPCKLLNDNTTPTSMALGSTQNLTFQGSAVHGGGSCQISITYDLNPTKSSVFKVIHSIEGGCPARNSAGNNPGNADVPDPDAYNFQIPTNLPLGKATIAWTWFNKVGNREMYMNCGPILLTGASSKRSDGHVERDQAAFNSLPNMFTANIGNIGNDGCSTTENVDLKFPNPGASVDNTESKLPTNLQGPAGTCVDKAGAAVPPAAASSAAAASAPAASAGVFATVAASSPAAAATSAAASTPAASSPAPAAVSPSNAPAVPAASASPVASSGSTTPGSPCSPEGLWNCIGGTSFQQCGSGRWSVVEQLAAGTTCTPGQSTAIKIAGKSSKRAIRFSSEHVRRHVRKSI